MPLKNDFLRLFWKILLLCQKTIEEKIFRTSFSIKKVVFSFVSRRLSLLEKVIFKYRVQRCLNYLLVDRWCLKNNTLPHLRLGYTRAEASSICPTFKLWKVEGLHWYWSHTINLKKRFGGVTRLTSHQSMETNRAVNCHWRVITSTW